MLVTITNAVQQTQTFIVFLLIAVIASSRMHGSISLSKERSAELKGVAILTVIFAHIGYYLTTDTSFLSPLSISAGVGVNVFLFLSGYGLTHSALQHHDGILGFYKKRLSKIFIPLWIILPILLLADWLFLHITRSPTTIWQSLIGFFPKADLYESIDSPLWYFTFIIGNYVIFPLVFWKRAPILSAVALTFIARYIAKHVYPSFVDEGVQGMYLVHLYAFPLGMAVAGAALHAHQWFGDAFGKLRTEMQKHPRITLMLRWTLSAILLGFFAYGSLHADIGQGAWPEQKQSLITMTSLILLFMLKPFESRFLALVGIYSYEIYLFHWPLLYRYDFLYTRLPPALATMAWLLCFVVLGKLFQETIKQLSSWPYRRKIKGGKEAPLTSE